jgi:hypothetical protein
MIRMSICAQWMIKNAQGQQVKTVCGAVDGPALERLFERVSAWQGVRVEFVPEAMGKGPKRHAMIYEPGGIRIEFDCATTAKQG